MALHGMGIDYSHMILMIVIPAASRRQCGILDLPIVYPT